MIRPEAQGDEDAIRAVQTAAFGREREAQIAEDLRAGDAFVPNLSLVFEDGGILGHVVVSRGRVEPTGDPILVLGPIGVTPERQHQGIGSALLRAALAGARERGATCVALLGDPGYYERFGFVPAEPLGLLPPEGWPSRAFQVVLLDPEAELPQGRVAVSAAFDD